MSASFLTKLGVRKGGGPALGPHATFGMVVGLVLWTLLVFSAARELLPRAALYVMRLFGISPIDIDQTGFMAASAVLVYGATILGVIGLPWLVRKSRTSREDIGLPRLVSWTEIGLAPLGLVIYFLISGILVYATSRLLPGIDLQQAQDTGFGTLTQYYQYLLAFLTLVVVAPVAEETIFRGYLYGKLRKVVPVWLAMLVTSVAFGLAHGQWNVAIDVFALSMVACSLREITGSIWAGVLLHMLKNGIAYYILFINPVFSHTMGG